MSSSYEAVAPLFVSRVAIRTIPYPSRTRLGVRWGSFGQASVMGLRAIQDEELFADLPYPYPCCLAALEIPCALRRKSPQSARQLNGK